MARCLKHCDHFREVRIGRVAEALADAVQAFCGAADGFRDGGSFFFNTAISVGSGQALAFVIDRNAFGRDFDAVFIGFELTAVVFGFFGAVA